MKKPIRLLIASLAVLLTLGMVSGVRAGSKPFQDDSGPVVGSKAPNFKAVDQDGVSFKLSDYRGKVVVLDFWGYW